MFKLALYGDNGAGKTTCARLLREIAGDHGIGVETVQMAAPLYELQAEVYSRARRPLANRDLQDERLLSVLASELRRINPRVFHEYVADAIFAASTRSHQNECLLLVEDSRPIDRSILQELGFHFVHIWADSFTRQGRRHMRGDFTTDSIDALEIPTIGNDEVIKNTSDLLCLRGELSHFLGKFLRP